MIFSCFICKKYKFWNRKCFEVIAVDDNGEDLFTRKLCQSCGEQVDFVYQQGKKIAEMEMVEDQEDEPEQT